MGELLGGMNGGGGRKGRRGGGREEEGEGGKEYLGWFVIEAKYRNVYTAEYILCRSPCHARYKYIRVVPNENQQRVKYEEKINSKMNTFTLYSSLFP